MADALPADIEHRIVVDRNSPGTSIKCTLDKVVHAYLDRPETDTEASLLVFSFELRSTVPSRRRLKAVEVRIQLFTDEDDEAMEIQDFSPSALYLQPTKIMETQMRSRAIDLEIGGVGLPTAGFGGTKETETIRELSYAARVAGMSIFDNNDRCNTIVWKILENPHTKAGVPISLRTAVLIRRRSRARFSADVHIVEDPAMQGESILQYMRGMLGAFREEPVVFDPEGRNKDYDVHEELQPLVENVKYNSQRLIDVELSSIVAVEHPLVSTDFGESTNQKLFNIAMGLASQARYQFKPFETLTLLNLYHYQDKLISLHKEIHKAGKVDDGELSNLATLLREYHEALKSFKEISQLDRSSEEKRTAAVSLLNTILGNEHYDPAIDPLWMIDLTPDGPAPTADPIRRSLQQLQLKIQALVKPQESSTPGQRARKQQKLRSSRRKPRDHSSTMRITPLVDKISRVLVSIVGGAFLIVPMVILMYVSAQQYQIVTVVLFVLLFSVSFALTSTASNQELVGATAAYAAVLVVFVSQNSS